MNFDMEPIIKCFTCGINLKDHPVYMVCHPCSEMKWISVKERLPEINGIRTDCLITDGISVYLGCYGLDFGEIEPYFAILYTVKVNGVTHWMPLPELPEKKD